MSDNLPNQDNIANAVHEPAPAIIDEVSSVTVEEKIESVVEAPVQPEVSAPAPVVEEPAPVPTPEESPAPVPVQKKYKNNSSAGTELGVTTFAGEAVKLSKLVYKANSRNSASVIAVKTRLTELGYVEASYGRPGWIDDYAVEAVKKFQADKGLTVDGVFSRETVEALLAGTPMQLED
jgi:murein L,D-transpeptidase YcbB/YkuD